MYSSSKLYQYRDILDFDPKLGYGYTANNHYKLLALRLIYKESGDKLDIVNTQKYAFYQRDDYTEGVNYT